MRRFALLIILLLITISVIVSAQDEPAPDTVRLTASSYAIGTANTLIAVEEGFFEAQGVRLEFVENVANSTYSPEPMTLLIAGQIDVFQVPLTPGLFNTVLRGADIKAVAVANYEAPGGCSYNNFYTSAGSSARFQTAEGWRGARYASGGLIGLYFLEGWLQQIGLTAAPTTLVSRRWTMRCAPRRW